MNELSEFIKTHVEEINKNDFTEVYRDAERAVGVDDIGRLTDLFVDAEINPLLYVKNIPEYYMCRSSHTHIEIPENIVKIGTGAFYGCTGLTSVTISNGVTIIGNHAFDGCTGLTSITIPDSVTSIGERAFDDCSGLTTVNWNATACTSAGSYNYPIFNGCSNLATVNIGDNVKIIPSYAFRDCTGLTSVTIGNSVIRIESNAFYNCLNLTTINFNGTIAQWNSIEKSIRWDYNTGNYTIHCIDGELKK